MKIGFGNDHAAVELKETLMRYVSELGHECVDFGTNSTDSVDYPEYGLKVAEAIKAGEIDKGILICGTGIGISLAANKVPGIRAAVCSEPFTARMTVQHNNANILAMGARVVGEGLAKLIVDAFLEATYEGGRHQIRVDMLTDIENKYKD